MSEDTKQTKTREEFLAERKARQAQLNEGGGGIQNPAVLTIRWKQDNEKKKAVIDGREIDVTIVKGGFAYFRRDEQDKTKGENIFIPQEKFAMLVIDHSIVRIMGSEYANGGKTKVCDYYSNECRQSDLYTTPFILKHKAGDAPVETYVDTYKNLKDNLKIRNRMHIIYALTPKNEIVKIVLPYYSYSLNTTNFKTHGSTFLDADKASEKGGMLGCWLQYDGFVKLQANDKSPEYTAPKFFFKEEATAEWLERLEVASKTVDEWYKASFARDIEFIDKFRSGSNPESQERQETQYEHNQEHQSHHDHQTKGSQPQQSLHSDSAFHDGFDDDIPF